MYWTYSNLLWIINLACVASSHTYRGFKEGENVLDAFWILTGFHWMIISPFDFNNSYNYHYLEVISCDLSWLNYISSSITKAYNVRSFCWFFHSFWTISSCTFLLYALVSVNLLLSNLEASFFKVILVQEWVQTELLSGFWKNTPVGSKNNILSHSFLFLSTSVTYF